MHFFPIGEKIYIYPLFSFPFNHFFPPTCYLAIFFLKRKIYIPEIKTKSFVSAFLSLYPFICLS